MKARKIVAAIAGCVSVAAAWLTGGSAAVPKTIVTVPNAGHFYAEAEMQPDAGQLIKEIDVVREYGLTLRTPLLGETTSIRVLRRVGGNQDWVAVRWSRGATLHASIMLEPRTRHPQPPDFLDAVAVGHEAGETVWISSVDGHAVIYWSSEKVELMIQLAEASVRPEDAVRMIHCVVVG